MFSPSSPRLAMLAGLLLWLIGWACPASAQTWQVSNWHVDDGLPFGDVTAIAQTPDGYLWVGTPMGVARFDGIKFTVFRANEVPGLADSRIVSLLAAKDGTLWVGTLGGTLARWVGRQFETLSTPLPVDQDLQRAPGSWSWGRASHLVEDEQGGIWWQIAGKGGARFYQGKWRLFTEADGLPANIWQLFRDHEGTVWAEGDGKLFQFDGARWQPAAVPTVDGADPRFAPAAHGGLWVTADFETGMQIRRIDQHGWRQPAADEPPLAGSGPVGVRSLLEDRRGRLWAGLGRGGVSWLDGQGQWRPLENQGALEGSSVYCLMEDRQGNLWAGTGENGLFRIVPKPVSLLPAVKAPDSVTAVCAMRDGTAWIGTHRSGVYQMHPRGWVPVNGDWGNTIPKIFNFLEDSHGVLWAATSSGLYRWDGGRFQQVPAPFPAMVDVSVLTEGKAGNLWVGTLDGRLISWQGDELLSYAIPGEVRTLGEDDSGALWVGTVGAGLFHLSAENPRRLEKVADYSASDATTLLDDSRGTLWVGSWGAGLFRYREGKIGNQMPRGLPAGRIVGIFNDPNDMLWVSSTNGIFSISRAVLDAYVPGKSPPLLWQHFSLEQGLNHRSSSGAGARVDGKLWFPNFEQIAVIDPAVVTAGLMPANVRIESVVADGRELPAMSGSKLSVSSATRRLAFRYTALDLTAPASMLFRYKLDGMDEAWVDAGGARSAAYSKLPPGDYRFRVMAGGADGRWLEAGEPVHLKVVPRWWERTWLRWLMALAAMSLFTGGIVRRQARKARLKLQQMRMERQLDAERSRIARNIHDEMGANLTYISQLSDLARNHSGSGDELDRIHDASLELTRTMDEIVWAVDPGHDTLDSLVNYLSRVASNHLRAAGVRCRVDFPMEIPEVRITSQVRHSLFLVFKEALHNVVKHASATEARLTLEFAGDTFTLVIEDNGRGFDPSAEHQPPEPGDHRISSGHGLPNMAERLRQIGGTLVVNSRPGRGTRLAMRVLTGPQSKACPSGSPS